MYFLKNERPTWCHFLFYFTSYVLNMFWTLIYPSSGACDCVAVLLFILQAEACKTNTTQNQPHQSSNTQRTENKMTDVVIQQHSRKLLMMDILMSETCWVHNKWNKMASDIKSVFHSSTITRTMMHGAINIRSCISVQYLWKYGFAKSSDNLYAPCILLNQENVGVCKNLSRRTNMVGGSSGNEPAEDVHSGWLTSTEREISLVRS